jgi:hypothetical protein
MAYLYNMSELESVNGFFIPTDTININEIMTIIHNNEFEQYLYDIMDGKHTYHIFNTYLYFEYKSLLINIKGYFPFFILLSLKSKQFNDPLGLIELVSEKGLASILNDIYSGFLKKVKPDFDPKKDQVKVNFDTDMQRTVDIFIHIFNNPTDDIFEGCKYKNQDIICKYKNQDIIDIIIKSGIIHKKIYNGEGDVKDKEAWDIMNTFQNIKMIRLAGLIKYVETRYVYDTSSETSSDTGSDIESVEGIVTLNTKPDIESVEGTVTLNTKPDIVSNKPKSGAVSPSSNLKNATARLGRSGIGSRRRRGPHSPRKGGKSTRKAKHANERKTKRQPKQNRKTKRQPKQNRKTKRQPKQNRKTKRPRK